SIYWRSKLLLLRAAFRHIPLAYADERGMINNDLRRAYFEADSPVKASEAMMALTEFPWNYRFIWREGSQAAIPMVRHTSVEALAQISALPDFNRYFGQSRRRVRNELASYFREAIRSGKPQMVLPAAQALANTDRNYNYVFNDLQFLDSALLQLELPEATSAYNALQEAKASLTSTSPPPPLELPVKPIDWSLLNDGEWSPMAFLSTDKGVIKLKLMPELAPATVSNFIQLARDGFYEGKMIYRIVPNFVIQGASSAAEEAVGFRIRTEVPPARYDQQGTVGMASSGPDTESVHFFITHSPTPHLDGNYTIFARVVDNMPVVHDIQLGDRIQQILIQQ
ncbi:MAG: peptidylprolyl isomerase, partial [Saprospiraceae bacterium]|nr:peptidylprolyl isomerase [Saprospiraceae bacterium]